jgi:N-acetylmuramoyl-L-alanine amidase
LLTTVLACGFAHVEGAHAASCSKPDFNVVIDVGHTPDAPGAISARRKTELEFNLQLSALIEARLRAMGYVRTFRWISWPGASMAVRVGAENAKRPDVLVSIHHDSVQPIYLQSWNYEGTDALYSDHAKGWSLFVSLANAHPAESLSLARSVADRLLKHGLTFSMHHAEPIQGEGRSLLDKTRGIYRRDGLYVLTRSSAPAVLLEAGVIVNPEEEIELSSTPRQEATAEAVSGAIDEFCGREMR